MASQRENKFIFMKFSLNDNKNINQAPRWVRIYVLALLGLAGILALAAIVITFGWAGGVGRFMQEGWGGFAAVIMRNRIVALWHGAFLTCCVAAFLWLFLSAPRKPRIVFGMAKWGLLLLVAADALYLSRHYVKTMPLSDMAENEVIRLLKADMPERRVALVSQAGFYNIWLTYQFPYHGIKTLNVTQMPRMPIDYKNFLETAGRHPLRLWQMAAVGYVLAPAQVWGQIQQDSRMRDAFELAYAYNIIQEEMAVSVIPATPANPGQHVVLRLKAPAPHYALIAGWEKLGDVEVLKRLADDSAPLFDRVWVAPASAQGLPVSTGRGMAGTVTRLSSSARSIVLEVAADQPAILRIADKYDPDWKVWVDGSRTPLLRVDYIFQGVYLEPGLHEVVLRYAPPTWPIWCQGLGVLLCLGAIVGIIACRRAAACQHT